MKWSGNESMAVPPWENLASFPGSSTPEPGNEAIESSRENLRKQKQGIKWRVLLLEPLNFCSKGVGRSCAMEDGDLVRFWSYPAVRTCVSMIQMSSYFHSKFHNYRSGSVCSRNSFHEPEDGLWEDTTEGVVRNLGKCKGVFWWLGCVTPC